MPQTLLVVEPCSRARIRHSLHMINFTTPLSGIRPHPDLAAIDYPRHVIGVIGVARNKFDLVVYLARRRYLELRNCCCEVSNLGKPGHSFVLLLPISPNSYGISKIPISSYLQISSVVLIGI
jgi:hypothetical protein